MYLVSDERSNSIQLFQFNENKSSRRRKYFLRNLNLNKISMKNPRKFLIIIPFQQISWAGPVYSNRSQGRCVKLAGVDIQ